MNDVIIGEADLDEILRRLDQGGIITHQTNFFIELMQNNPTIDYTWIETRLRFLGCENLYLVAMPIETAPAGIQVKDIGGRFEARFWVWHSVNGREERDRTMVAYGIPMDDVRNLENLKLTGNLVV